MKESFLHYVWKHHYFDLNDLSTESGLPIQIVRSGTFNSNEGPDFIEATVKIGTITWSGQVEIHLRASDWNKHKHSQHPAYQNVILHVVYECDQTIYDSKNKPIETLVLKNRIDPTLIKKWEQLSNSKSAIPCQNQISNVHPIFVRSMRDRILTERLERKSQEVLVLLETNKGDWEETCYQWIAKNFGFHANSAQFLHLASATPLKIISKNSNSILSLEALLFGQAGLLDADSMDEYFWSLKREYGFIRHKFKETLSDQRDLIQWKFLRMRPSNFPSIRISQFAALLHKTNASLFSQLLALDVKSLRTLFEVSQSSYWHSHYLFGKKSDTIGKKIGGHSIDLLLINSVAVILVAYSMYKSEEIYLQKAWELLENITPEKNTKVSLYESLGIQSDNAFDSQSLIELHDEYCLKKNCLECLIGNQLLSNHGMGS